MDPPPGLAEKGLLSVPRFRTKYRTASFIFSASYMWNYLQVCWNSYIYTEDHFTSFKQIYILILYSKCLSCISFLLLWISALMLLPYVASLWCPHIVFFVWCWSSLKRLWGGVSYAALSYCSHSNALICSKLSPRGQTSSSWCTRLNSKYLNHADQVKKSLESSGLKSWEFFAML